MAKMGMTTPIGRLGVVADEAGLREIRFDDTTAQEASGGTGSEVCRAAVQQLREYFAGARRQFDLPLAPAGTEFQRRVWQQLEEIPFGRTICYGQLAAAIGKPKAARAVGLANGANPLPIVIPCHRVIGADGTLTGYGGGLDRKRWLLCHEGVTEGDPVRQPKLLR